MEKFINSIKSVSDWLYVDNKLSKLDNEEVNIIKDYQDRYKKYFK